MTKDRFTLVGEYLAQRLYEAGLKHIFGVPGDYVLEFFQCLEKSRIKVVTNCNELNAGYAADAYARLNGIGAVCVTYGVGGLSLYNAVMGSFAERVPVIAISGAPPTAEEKYHHLLHHTIGDMKRQLEIYEKATVYSVVLNKSAQAPDKIDEAISACIKYKRPVYIELPRDMVFARCRQGEAFKADVSIGSDKVSLDEAVEESAQILNNSKQPVILVGVEVHRLGLRRQTKKLIDSTGYPFVTTLLGKSVLNERHPQFAGIYGGAASWKSAKKVVESADAMLSLGALSTDIHLGARTSFIDESKMITVNSDHARIKHHLYHNVSLEDFINSIKNKLKKRDLSFHIKEYPLGDPKKAVPVRRSRKITHKWFYRRINRFIKDNNVIVADTGDSIFSASEMLLPRKTQFIDQAFYLSIGYSVPATLGVKLASPQSRPVTFVGDGSFQMTAQELSTICRLRHNPIFFLINNGGYTVERVMMDGRFNDLNNWKYYMLPEVFGWGWGCRVETEGELEDSLKRALANPDKLAFIEIALDTFDCCQGLLRIGESYKKSLRSMYSK